MTRKGWNHANDLDELYVDYDLFKLALRLWSKVEQGRPDQCWPWSGYKRWGGRPDPYGFLRQRVGPRVANKQKLVPVHRLVYWLENGLGSLKSHQLIRHLCNNTLCCNPRHLAQGTHRDNMADMVRAGRSLAYERNPRTLLTHQDVDRIRVLRSRGVKLKDLAMEYGVHLDTISKAAIGKTW